MGVLFISIAADGCAYHFIAADGLADYFIVADGLAYHFFAADGLAYHFIAAGGPAHLIFAPLCAYLIFAFFFFPLAIKLKFGTYTFKSGISLVAG